MNNNGNTYIYRGSFVKAMPPKSYGKNNNKLREFVVSTTRTFETRDGGQQEREELVAFKTFSQHLVVALDDIRPGAPVSVKFSVSGREWQGRVYTDLVAHGIEVAKSAAPEAAEPPPDLASASDDGMGDDEELPF